ncbi:MAG: hypothetical protein WCO45_10440 [Pseudanabaena sp. ELA607]
MRKYCKTFGLKTFGLQGSLLSGLLGLGLMSLCASAAAAGSNPQGLRIDQLNLSFTVNSALSNQASPGETDAPTEDEEETGEPPLPLTTSNAAPNNNAPLANCSNLAIRRYVILVNQPIDSLPQLPEFLTIAAAPCQYFGILMTSFGTFDNAESVILRADQLRQLKLDAVVHSFKGDVSGLNKNYRAYSVIAEMGSNPDNTVQQLQALRFSPQKVNLGNRTVLVVSPSSSLAPAKTVANNLRTRGFTTQVISASLLNRNFYPPADPNRGETATAQGATPNPASRPANSSKPPNSKPSPKPTANNAALPAIPPLPQGKVYRLLIPMRNAETLTQARAIASDAFPCTIQGKRLIQVRSYTDRDNVTRERNRFNERFPGTIVIIE